MNVMSQDVIGQYQMSVKLLFAAQKYMPCICHAEMPAVTICCYDVKESLNHLTGSLKRIVLKNRFTEMTCTIVYDPTCRIFMEKHT